MANRYTTLNALAFLAITRQPRKVRLNTRLALMGAGLIDRLQVGMLTPEGEALLQESRVWKAHQRMVEAGFRWDPYSVNKNSMISYKSNDDGRSGFIDDQGRAVAQHPKGAGLGSGFVVLEKYNNG